MVVLSAVLALAVSAPPAAGLTPRLRLEVASALVAEPPGTAPAWPPPGAATPASSAITPGRLAAPDPGGKLALAWFQSAGMTLLGDAAGALAIGLAVAILAGGGGSGDDGEAIILLSALALVMPGLAAVWGANDVLQVAAEDPPGQWLAFLANLASLGLWAAAQSAWALPTGASILVGVGIQLALVPTAATWRLAAELPPGGLAGRGDRAPSRLAIPVRDPAFAMR